RLAALQEYVLEPCPSRVPARRSRRGYGQVTAVRRSVREIESAQRVVSSVREWRLYRGAVGIGSAIRTVTGLQIRGNRRELKCQCHVRFSVCVSPLPQNQKSLIVDLYCAACRMNPSRGAV